MCLLSFILLPFFNQQDPQIHSNFCFAFSRGGSSDTVLKYDVEYIGSSMCSSQSKALPSANQVFQDHLVNYLILFFSLVGLWTMGFDDYVWDQLIMILVSRIVFEHCHVILYKMTYS